MGLERARAVAHAHRHPFGFDGPNGLFVHVASLNTRLATGWCGRCNRAGFPVAGNPCRQSPWGYPFNAGQFECAHHSSECPSDPFLAVSASGDGSPEVTECPTLRGYPALAKTGLPLPSSQARVAVWSGLIVSVHSWKASAATRALHSCARATSPIHGYEWPQRRNCIRRSTNSAPYRL
jgi:hypothetical protein